MKKYMTLTILFALIIAGCQQNPIGGDRDENGCLTPAGYSFDKDIGACTRNWELDEHEKEVVRNVLVVQSYSSFTVVAVEKIEDCNDCYDITLQRNPIGENTDNDNLIPYIIPYREGRIDYSYDSKITNFEECIAAGNPAMESYPRQCKDPITDTTFTETIKHICTQDEKESDICTMEYNPVCGEIALNTGEKTYKTYSNGCSACSDMNVVSHMQGECEKKIFVIDEETITGFDPAKYANDINGILVKQCPENFDAFTTQIGIQQCIPHYGVEDIEQWKTCEKSTDTCRCVKAYETTDANPIENAEYRCVPDNYAERLLFRSGIDSLDEKGKQYVIIA